MDSCSVDVRNFHVDGLRDGSLPVGSRGKTPVRGLWDDVLQKPNQFADTVYRFSMH